MSQVESKKRVIDQGEVFTSEREVNVILDLVKQETERIDSRLLEFVCENENFLAEVLCIKLAAVEMKYKKSQLDYERYAIIAISSIYGVDILEDNVRECCEREFNIYDEQYPNLYKTVYKEEGLNLVKFLPKMNILLELSNPNTKKPIIFPEWYAAIGRPHNESSHKGKLKVWFTIPHSASTQFQ